MPNGTTGQSPDAVPADENEATEPVYVTWSGDFAGFLDMPWEPQPFPWGFRMLEGNRAVQTSEDPRISGHYTTVDLVDRAHADKRQTSLVRIENDEGAWQGPLTNVFLPDETGILPVRLVDGRGRLRGLELLHELPRRPGCLAPYRRGRRSRPGAQSPPEPDAALLEAVLDR